MEHCRAVRVCPTQAANLPLVKGKDPNPYLRGRLRCAGREVLDRFETEHLRATRNPVFGGEFRLSGDGHPAERLVLELEIWSSTDRPWPDRHIGTA